MPPAKLYELRNLYCRQGIIPTEKYDSGGYRYPYLPDGKQGEYIGNLRLDTDLLRQALSPRREYYDPTGSLCRQVFGRELQKQHLSLEHTAHLFQERLRLHRRHLQEIDNRHVALQERLFGVQINQFPDRNKQLRTLEGQLLQLEEQRRNAELAFWKDTVQLRRELWDAADSYQDTSRRYDIFGRVEEDFYGRK